MMAARKGQSLQAKKDIKGAMEQYQAAIDGGFREPATVLRYCILLVRNGEYQKARELIVEIQNSTMNEDNRTTMLCTYATCVYKLGDLEKGIRVLEGRHAKAPSGLLYETLGYLYVEAGDFEKALTFNTEALDYDDEDAVTLDNLGQVYYRLSDDKETAKTYFERALAIKPGQIDTLWFLSRYDLEAGNTAAAREKLEKAAEGRFSPLNYATREMVDKELKRLA